jgi:hypothetical protein
MRRWVRWTVLSVWGLTAATVLMMANVRRNTPITLRVAASEIAFDTTAGQLLHAASYDDVILSRVRVVEITSATGDYRRLEGDSFGSCSFANVRAEAIRLTKPSRVQLRAGGDSLSVKATESMEGRLTSQASPSRSSVTCTRVGTGTYAADLSSGGGDGIVFATAENGGIDVSARPLVVEDRQIPITGPLRFTAIDGRTGDEKSALLAGTDAEVNQVSFERTDEELPVDPADVLVVEPAGSFWLRSVSTADGLRLSFRGLVQDVRLGGGAGDLQSVMPTLLDEWIALKGMLALIPAVAAGVIALLERAGLLAKT